MSNEETVSDIRSKAPVTAYLKELLAENTELKRQNAELLEALEELVDFASIDHKHTERSAMAFTTARLAIDKATKPCEIVGK